MKILVFSTVFYPSVGGIENHTLLLIKNFVEKGHQVKVITFQKQIEPIKYIDVFYKPSIIKSIKLFLWCDTYFMPNISLKGAWLLGFQPKKNWVISHNDFSSCDKTGLLSSIKNFTTRFASTNIAVSKSIATYLQHSVAVVRNCYDDKLFKIYETEERNVDFVFLGRLVSQKGADLLIKACHSLKKPFSLLIIGDGPEKKNLIKLTARLGLTDNIKFLGAMSGEPLARCLNRCHTMVVPSIQGEGFGMVVLEGLACGCKIIAANAAGLTEAVGEYGQKFEMGDQKMLTELLNETLIDNDTDEPNKIDLNNYLENHSVSMVSDSYLEYFN